MKEGYPHSENLIKGIPVGKELVVQKSKPLLSLGRSDLTLPEFKILDTYLARINSHVPDQRWVRFEKGELEKILGVVRINMDDLKRRLRNLCLVVPVEDPDVIGGFSEITLFERWTCVADENGLWQVDLKCTEDAKRYIFNIENLGYLRYKLRAIANLHSRYSYLLFLYLENNKYRSSWDISVDELRTVLKCTDIPSYQPFKRFNERILKRTQSELLERIDYRFEYEPLRVGRSVRYIRFTMLDTAQTLPQNPAPEVPHVPDDTPKESKKNPRAFIISACTTSDGNPAFSPAEQRQILSVMMMIPDNRLPSYGIAGTDITTRRHSYLRERYADLERRMEAGIVKKPFTYFLKMLKTDAGIE